MVKNEAERAESKAIRELRKKNSRLAFEVRRLRKMLKRVESDYDEADDEDTDDMVQPEIITKPKPKCPKCGQEGAYVFQLMDRDYYRCDHCQSKGRFPTKH